MFGFHISEENRGRIFTCDSLLKRNENVPFLKFIYLFIIYFCFVAACRLSLSCGEQELLIVAVRGPLTMVASLVLEHGLQACGLQ